MSKFMNTSDKYGDYIQVTIEDYRELNPDGNFEEKLDGIYEDGEMIAVLVENTTVFYADVKTVFPDGETQENRIFDESIDYVLGSIADEAGLNLDVIKSEYANDNEFAITNAEGVRHFVNIWKEEFTEE